VRGDGSHIDGAAQVWAEATAFREGDPDVAGLEDSRPIIAMVMDQPRAVLAVALDDDDQVVAFAVAAPARDGADLSATKAEVEYMGVRPGYWGDGLAHGVMELLCAELGGNGFTSAQLMVYATNDRAVGVYEHLGWQAEGTPTPHPRTGKPEQRYSRALPSH
jgi:GNAT superfamily N-acetyltransferase